MGLAASQARYLALTARKSDLEFQSQTINTRRIQLAYKTAEIARAYSEGMNNQRIKMATSQDEKGNNIYTELNFKNLMEGGYMLIGINGTGLTPAPYILENAEEDDYYYPNGDGITIDAKDWKLKSEADKAAYIPNQGTTYKIDDYKSASQTDKDLCTPNFIKLSQAEYDKLPDNEKTNGGNTSIKIGDETLKYKWVQKNGEWFKQLQYPAGKGYNDLDAAGKAAVGEKDGYFVKNYTHATSYKLKRLTKTEYEALSTDMKAKYKSSPALKTTYKVNEDYKDEKGFNVQALLTSGKAQIVSKQFFDFLVSEYGYSFNEGLTAEQYAKALDKWEDDTWNPGKAKSVIDPFSDETNMFQQQNYTEDDAAVLAKYTADTAEIQAQDKRLEMEEKNIETQHKAIEVELESIQKVIQNNIDKTFKIFT